MTKLTARQQQVLDFIRQYMGQNHMPPTRAEIARELGFKSPNAAEEHLKALARKGAIEMIPGASRGIRLPQGAQAGASEVPVVAEASAGLPIIGRVAAGSPTLASEHIEAHCPVQPDFFDPPADFMLRVNGTSMKDIGIYDDDLVAIARTASVRDGDIIVARVNDDVTLKRYYRDKDCIRLVAENEEFSDIRVTEADDFTIEGRYVGVIRRGLH
ncbi:MAG: transcriptional repressor LexA [Natronospirillum sp.]|uniref:transcriptional repressor LexA n=1 Tax=Natronospirillum sp. TaxID=2812955 RepID=UPI0025F401D6|nr:transcriptional repressor LexA [Natronospirillum sp.]MCH8552738.1 transcriptional repressor LexA [Natronospirillum sp.]